MNELTTEIIAALAQSKIWTKFFVTTSKLRLTSCFKPNWQSFWVTNATHTLGLTLVITATAVMSARLIRSTANLT